MFINGKWREAEKGGTFESFNPASGESLGKFPAGEGIDTTKAIDAADRFLAMDMAIIYHLEYRYVLGSSLARPYP